MLMYTAKKRMCVSVVFLSLAILATCAESPQETVEIAGAKDDEFIGTWRFISMEARSPEGEVIYPYGENIFGRLIYTAEGLMSVLLMKPGRPRFGSDDPMAGTTDEIEAAYRGFDAYCGTYTIDEEQATVTHRIQASKFPNWIGSDQVRSFEHRDGRLILKADIGTVGEIWKFEAILEKLESAQE